MGKRLCLSVSRSAARAAESALQGNEIVTVHWWWALEGRGKHASPSQGLPWGDNPHHHTHQMMFKPKKALTLLALAGLALAPAATNAAVTAYSADDLIMGIHQTGNAQTLLINLGQASGFTSGSAAGTVISGLSSVLSSTFGSGWATDPTISWGIAGSPGGSAAGGDPLKVLYASSPETTYGTLASPFSDSSYTRLSSSIQGTGATNIAAMGATFAGLTASAVGSSGNVAAALQASSTINGWSAQNAGAGGTSFSYFNTLEGSFANGVDSSALDLYRMQVYNQAPSAALGTPGTYVGSFTLSSSGSINFSTSAPGAAPEPTRAVLFGAGLAGLMLRRRRAVRSPVVA